MPIPPSGKAIIFRLRPLKVRGKVMRLPALGGPEAGFSAAAARRAEGCGSSPAIPRTLPANAPPAATFFRNSRLSSFPFFVFLGICTPPYDYECVSMVRNHHIQ